MNVRDRTLVLIRVGLRGGNFHGMSHGKPGNQYGCIREAVVVELHTDGMTGRRQRNDANKCHRFRYKGGGCPHVANTGCRHVKSVTHLSGEVICVSQPTLR